MDTLEYECLVTSIEGVELALVSDCFVGEDRSGALQSNECPLPCLVPSRFGFPCDPAHALHSSSSSQDSCA